MNFNEAMSAEEIDKQTLSDQLFVGIKKLIESTPEKESVPGRLSHGWLTGELGQVAINSSYVYISRVEMSGEQDSPSNFGYRLLLKRTVDGETTAMRLEKEGNGPFLHEGSGSELSTDELIYAIDQIDVAREKRIIPPAE